MNDKAIFAEFNNQELADAINAYLETSCWKAQDVINWRGLFIEKGYMPTVCYCPTTGYKYPAIAGDEYSNFGFICFLEDRMHGNYYDDERMV
jgi:hypothetical protein